MGHALFDRTREPQAPRPGFREDRARIGKPKSESSFVKGAIVSKDFGVVTATFRNLVKAA